MKMWIVLLSILVCISNGVVFGRHVKYEIPNRKSVVTCRPECESKIYCLGRDEDGEFTLLHDVQTSGLYEDGTEFVKKGSKYTEEEILKAYAEAKKNYTIHPNYTYLDTFVKQYFFDEILENVTLADFESDPEQIEVIKNAKGKFKEWLTDLNNLWKQLAKRTPIELANTTSYIGVPKPFIIAGGRFSEMYYWDSYWIVKGLLACNMNETAKGVIENMIYLVKNLSYIPNGNRIYYKNRSQPPMLIQMAKIYVDATNDTEFIRDNLETFEKEFKWWFDNRRVKVVTKEGKYHLFRYHAVSCHPRPESYREDFRLLRNYDPNDVDEKLRIYTGIRSGAESGWDFSSRHMKETNYCEDVEDGLSNMNPQEYAYVDLNSIIHSNVKMLADWKQLFGNKEAYLHDERVQFYNEFAKKMLDAIENVLWNDSEGIWLDYNLLNGRHRNLFFASNLTPLWSRSYRKSSKIKSAIDYLKKNKIINDDFTMNSSLNGVPTSSNRMKNSKQQWDYSNLWAPLQSFVVRGLYDSNDSDAMKVAMNLATAFVNTTYLAYYEHEKNRGKMFEKYSTETRGKEGGGGEYEIPTGFGWTNGYIFELFTMWNCFPIFPNKPQFCCE